jgi:hypothetical protein
MDCLFRPVCFRWLGPSVIILRILVFCRSPRGRSLYLGKGRPGFVCCWQCLSKQCLVSWFAIYPVLVLSTGSRYRTKLSRRVAPSPGFCKPEPGHNNNNSIMQFHTVGIGPIIFALIERYMFQRSDITCSSLLPWSISHRRPQPDRDVSSLQKRTPSKYRDYAGQGRAANARQ